MLAVMDADAELGEAPQNDIRIFKLEEYWQPCTRMDGFVLCLKQRGGRGRMRGEGLGEVNDFP